MIDQGSSDAKPMKIGSFQVPDILVRFIKFGITGVGPTLVHIGVVVLCIEILRFTPGISNGIAYLVASVFSYTVNTYWSFSGRNTRGSLLRYPLVLGVIAIIAFGISKTAELLGFHYWVGVTAFILIVPVLTFLGHHFWTYRNTD